MIYRSSCFLGEFRVHKDDDHSWHLCLSGHRIGSFRSPEEAVDAVRNHRTGFRVWDKLTAYSMPDFSQWERATCPCKGHEGRQAARDVYTCKNPAPLPGAE